MFVYNHGFAYFKFTSFKIISLPVLKTVGYVKYNQQTEILIIQSNTEEQAYCNQLS